MSETSNEIVVSSKSLRNEISAMNEGKQTVFSTFKGEDFATKVATLNAVTNSEPISENIGTVINLRNWIVQVVEMENETTKQMEEQPRLILVDADGKAYHAISGGLYKSLENIAGVLGQPDTWEGPLPIIVDRIKGKQGHFFTIKIAG